MNNGPTAIQTPCDADVFAEHESVHFFQDAASGLRAIVAIHSTVLGPAVGGCRYWRYAQPGEAVQDVLRLSRGMSYKNALADLPLGGGKAVILHTDAQLDRDGLFQAFGAAIDSLGGRYITAQDVGTRSEDMRTIATRTRFVSGLAASSSVAGGDPSPWTALGVFMGLQSAWAFASGKPGLNGVRVAVQGLGGVGANLCRLLHQQGALLQVADVDPARVAQAVAQLGATAVAADEVLAADVDILAPCALGGVLNAVSIPTLRARVIAGGANNQLATPADGETLRARGIIYAPDYVINAGGIICAASEYLGVGSEESVRRRIGEIPTTLQRILRRADEQQRATSAVADEMAEQRIAAAAAAPQRAPVARKRAAPG